MSIVFSQIKSKVKSIFSTDPYVSVTLKNKGEDVGETLRTSTVKGGGVTCEFTQENRLEFPLSHFPESISKTDNDWKLEICVFDEDVLTSDNLIGLISVPIGEYWSNEISQESAITFMVKEKISKKAISCGVKPRTTGALLVTIWRCLPRNVLVVEVWGVENLIPNPDGSSISRKYFIIASIVFAIYFAVGIAVFSTSDGMNPARDDGDPVMNSFYFVSVIISTVGYGDVLPLSDGMKIFTSFYAVTGVCILGSVVGVSTAYFVEFQQNLVRKLLTSGEQLQEKEYPFWIQLFKVWLPFLILFSIGLIWFRFWENYDGSTAFYVNIISLLTIGYGDFSFQGDNTNADGKNGRVFGAFYLLIGTTLLGKTLGKTIELIAQKKNDELASSKLERIISPELIKKMDTNNSGSVDENEFLMFMLQHVKSIGQSDLDLIKERFKQADRDGSGTLSLNDLVPKKKVVRVAHRGSSVSYRKRPSLAEVEMKQMSHKTAHLETIEDEENVQTK